MTITPFPRPAGLPATEDAWSPTGITTPVTGYYRAPSGHEGRFTGTYRFDRLVDQFGQPAAAGVFSGELVDADGRHVGRGSRRHTAAVDVAAAIGGGRVLRIGPVDVNVHGFLVTMDEMDVLVDERRAHTSGRQG